MGLFHRESRINTEEAAGLEDEEEEAGKERVPIREKKPCQPITWVTGSQAKLYRDGALGCHGSTKSEGDKGGKAFTTSAAEKHLLPTTKGTWQNSLVPIPS